MRLGRTSLAVILGAASLTACTSSAGTVATGTAVSRSSAPITGSTLEPASSPAGTSSADTNSAGTVPSVTPRAETIVTGLAVPWGLGFLPDGRAILTERGTAAVKIIAVDHSVTTVGTVDGVVPAGEGGLLGLAVSPSFATDGTIFVYYTAATDNRIAALTLADGRISGQRVILTGLPKNTSHNGGRLAFGPDGWLYVGTGDAQQRPSAQDPTYLGGKILRISPTGGPAPDHPFPTSPLVYSIGHRNVQGLAFDQQGRLWASEFGQNTWDELNLISAGADYGWPIVEGPGQHAGFTAPQRVWPTADASPSGIAILGGSVWMAGLKGARLWQIPLQGSGTGEPVAWFTGEFGRLRTAVVAPDGSLWVTTSNTDGRGSPQDGDDRILRITLS